MKQIKKIIIFLFIPVLLICLLTIYFRNNNRIFSKYIYTGNKENEYPEIGNDIRLKLRNYNRDVHGLLSIKGDILFVIFHGSGSTINSMTDIAKKIYDYGYSTLLIEYPGYGLSYKFIASERNIYDDSLFMIKHVRQYYEYRSDSTIIVGKSLGTGVAVEMMRHDLGRKLILISSITSLPDILHKKVFPVLPYIIITEKYFNRQKAKGILEEVLLLHGTEDATAPYSMALDLNDKFINSRLISINGATHKNILDFFTGEIWNEIFIFGEPD